ncbi:ATP-grasp domain-containing protein [Desulfocicer vacuolatum DSM 3385]|uniref:ATP-grasp domain-containing protein n=2 Tax=Desulfocicer vacuolatum TaxID=2298 RepID=A0A1W2AYG7_9BACT|nr:ATP-grasp domain-containing protein [Desulfocicer vacuolatum DSM 3385]
MPLCHKIAVVGTTPDYIDLLRKKAPEQLLFITQTGLEKSDRQEVLPAQEEMLCELSRPEAVMEQLKKHLKNHSLAINGIACFDCESMMLAAYLARELNLSYHSLQTIKACRDKSVTRSLWQQNGIETPRAQRIASAPAAMAFLAQMEGPCVLKPVEGSGSERVYRCDTALACETAWYTICSLQKQTDVIMETFVEGNEYSCDFLMTPQGARPIRFTRKIHSPIPVFGTIMAYELVNFPRGNISPKNFERLLTKAARVLGIKRGICMLDFIVTETGASLLEMTPRPGGDCLPWLIEKGMNLDILALNITLAAQPAFKFQPSRRFSSLVGLRIHGHRTGILKAIDTSRLMPDNRVREVYIKHKPGHMIQLPPKNYDSWNLGHILFKPSPLISCEHQCLHLLSLLNIDICHGKTPPNGGTRQPPKKSQRTMEI